MQLIVEEEEIETVNETQDVPSSGEMKDVITSGESKLSERAESPIRKRKTPMNPSVISCFATWHVVCGFVLAFTQITYSAILKKSDRRSKCATTDSGSIGLGSGFLMVLAGVACHRWISTEKLSLARILICLTAGIGFIVCPLMIRAAANYRESDALNVLNLIMLLLSSVEFVISCGTLLHVVDFVTLVDREALARPSFALKIAVYACHILFGLIILVVQLAAFTYDLHLRVRFYDIGVVIGCFLGIIGLCGICLAVCGDGCCSVCGFVAIDSDRAFRFASSIIGAVLSFVLLGLSMDDLPKSLLWCYDDERQWFLVGLYLALTSSSFFEIFIFIFFLRIAFLESSTNASEHRSNGGSDPNRGPGARSRDDDDDDDDAAADASEGCARRRKSNAQTAASENRFCNHCRLPL